MKLETGLRPLIVIGLALALSACASTNKRLSSSHGVSVRTAMEAHVVPMDPAKIETGPTETSAQKAAVARGRYNSGASSRQTVAKGTGGK